MEKSDIEFRKIDKKTFKSLFSLTRFIRRSKGLYVASYKKENDFVLEFHYDIETPIYKAIWFSIKIIFKTFLS